MHVGISFYSEKELKKFKFRSIGKNVLIKKNVGLYFIENTSIGNNVRIDDNVIIVAANKKKPVRIGNYIHIASNCYLAGSAGIEMSDFSGLAPCVQIFSSTDDYTGKKLTNPTVGKPYIGGKSGKVTLEKHVIIGAKSIILPGIIIEEGSSVGALSLVNKNLDAWGVYSGIPVKKLKNRFKNILKIEKIFLKKKYVMKKILLCISSDLGLKIYRLIKKHDVDIYSSNLNIKLNENFTVAKKREGGRGGVNANISYILNKKDFNNNLLKSKKKYDFIILVYWPWLVEKECFAKFCKSINFHPSFLPYGRGWYPHINAQIKKFIYGVTLHEINHNIDAGDIWCQKKILIPNFSKSNEIYKIAEKEIYQLFKNNYRKIFNKTLLGFKQSKVTSYLSKKKIMTLDKINLNSKMKVIDLINHIRIRTFKNKPFCYFIYKSQKRKIKITIY